MARPAVDRRQGRIAPVGGRFPSGALLLAAVAATFPAVLVAQDLVARSRELLRRNQIDSAYALIQRAVEAEPGQAEAQFALGEIAQAKARSAGGLSGLRSARRSRAAYERAVHLAPDNYEYLAGLAGLLGYAPGIAGGDRDSALVVADRARRLAPSRGTFLLAALLRRGNRRERTRADSLVDAYASAPSADRTARTEAAAYWAETDRPERALVLYEHLLAQDARDASARYGVARNLVVLRRDPQRAQVHLRWVIDNSPTGGSGSGLSPAAPWWRLGQTWVQLGRGDSAREAYRRALELDPQFRLARRSLDSLPRP